MKKTRIWLSLFLVFTMISSIVLPASAVVIAQVESSAAASSTNVETAPSTENVEASAPAASESESAPSSDHGEAAAPAASEGESAPSSDHGEASAPAASEGEAVPQFENNENTATDIIEISQEEPETEQNNEEAVKWYSLAAEKGDPEGLTNLAVCYESGIGIEKDAEKAVQLFMQAAEQGYSEAQLNLGILCYENEDIPGAVTWFMESARQGNPTAKYNLSQFCYYGVGVEKDEALAYSLAQEAAEAGLEEAASFFEIIQRNTGIGEKRTTGIDGKMYISKEFFQGPGISLPIGTVLMSEGKPEEDLNGKNFIRFQFFWMKKPNMAGSANTSGIPVHKIPNNLVSDFGIVN